MPRPTASPADPAATFVDSPWLVPFDGSFRVDDASTTPPSAAPAGKKAKKQLADVVDELADLQRVLYAHDRYAMLAQFQAMDAAGKDSTIRAVTSGVDPAGFQVYSFKQPSSEELDHDFLWRTTARLPERGRIGVFNRSAYEEVLVVRVHPEYLGGQRLPDLDDLDALWAQRYESLRDHERHLARNGTIVLKFWLNVSRDEQRRRFLDRLETRRKNWKFSAGDLDERALWDDYMAAYEGALAATSRPWAPWYAIPADDKPFLRLAVATILRDTMKALPLEYPKLDAKERAALGEMKKRLEDE